MGCRCTINEGGLPLNFLRMCDSFDTYGAANFFAAAFLSSVIESIVPVRVVSLCRRLLGRAVPLVIGLVVVGVELLLVADCGVVCPGNLFAALDGEDEGAVCLELLLPV